MTYGKELILIPPVDDHVQFELKPDVDRITLSVKDVVVRVIN